MAEAKRPSSLIEMFTRRQVRIFLKMFRLERLGNGVLAAEPFAEVNQPAALRAERPEFLGEPVAGLFAGGAADLRIISVRFRLQSF